MDNMMNRGAYYAELVYLHKAMRGLPAGIPSPQCKELIYARYQAVWLGQNMVVTGTPDDPCGGGPALPYVQWAQELPQFYCPH
jgi:hypothetical protein